MIELTQKEMNLGIRRRMVVPTTGIPSAEQKFISIPDDSNEKNGPTFTTITSLTTVADFWLESRIVEGPEESYRPQGEDSEPSASLDPEAEADLFERIHSLSHQNGRRCTTIHISHRFSTVRTADKIVVVEKGTIIECGSHAELMDKAGRYAEMFNLQKSGLED